MRRIAVQQSDLESIQQIVNSVNHLIDTRNQVEEGPEPATACHGKSDYGRGSAVELVVPRSQVIEAYDKKISEGQSELLTRLKSIVDAIGAVGNMSPALEYALRGRR